jgi:D-alanine-D-alanine ligase
VHALVPGTLTIAVLMGGGSREREVSLASGGAVVAALREIGHHVSPLDVKPGDVGPRLLAGTDVAFLALHGAWGEDGGIQAELEAIGMAYTFSGPEASRLAMDKAASKQLFLRHGVPTPPSVVAKRGDDRAVRGAWVLLGPDVVVKPVAEGSSIGVALCIDPASVDRAVAKVWADYDAALIERRVVGREFTVAVLGEEALPILEIRTPSGVYDYNDKYYADTTQYIFDHGLGRADAAAIAGSALAAHRALGCRDLSRVDVMWSTAGEPQVLEVNTIPGFTGHSLVPKAAARAGVPFGRLCERLLGMALERAHR